MESPKVQKVSHWLSKLLHLRQTNQDFFSFVHVFLLQMPAEVLRNLWPISGNHSHKFLFIYTEESSGPLAIIHCFPRSQALKWQPEFLNQHSISTYLGSPRNTTRNSGFLSNVKLTGCPVFLYPLLTPQITNHKGIVKQLNPPQN